MSAPGDRDPLRFALTGEAGMNDGSAFPFLMLGLGILGLHHLGPFGRDWVLVDVLWAIPGGLAIGALLGTVVGTIALYLGRIRPDFMNGADFLCLGLIALTYGAALMPQTYAFLAVFTAGVAMRKIEERAVGRYSVPERVIDEIVEEGEPEEVANDPRIAPAYMARSVLQFNEQFERLGQVGVMLLVGTMISTRYLPIVALWFVPLLFLVIRPLAAGIALGGSRATRTQRALISWFGVRGIGSIYYLMFAIVHGLPEDMARDLTGLTLTVVATSVVIHGVSVTPVMTWYNRRYARTPQEPAPVASGS